MRILYINTTLARYPGDPLGGAGNCYLDLYLEISKQAHVDIVAPLQKNSSQHEKVGNLTIYRASPIKPYGSFESMLKTKQVFKIPFMLGNLFRKALSLSRNKSYDVIHGFFIIPAGLIIRLLPTKGIKVIAALGTDIHTLSYKPFIASLYRFIFSKIDGVIYNTPEMKNRLKYLRAKNLEYIPTPLNRNTFSLSSPIPSLPNFVYIGRLTRTKGSEILLRAFKKTIAKMPKAKLTIIGDGPDKQEMLKFIYKNNLQNSITLTGALGTSQILKILERSYVLLMPSLREGTPSAVLEAMSVGRPVVATKTGGLKELVTKEVGYLTETGKTNQFAEAILTAYHTKYIPEKIREKTKQFDNKIIAKKYLNYYQKIKKLLSEK